MHLIIKQLLINIRRPFSGARAAAATAIVLAAVLAGCSETTSPPNPVRANTGLTSVTLISNDSAVLASAAAGDEDCSEAASLQWPTFDPFGFSERRSCSSTNNSGAPLFTEAEAIGAMDWQQDTKSGALTRATLEASGTTVEQGDGNRAAQVNVAQIFVIEVGGDGAQFVATGAASSSDDNQNNHDSFVLHPEGDFVNAIYNVRGNDTVAAVLTESGVLAPGRYVVRNILTVAPYSRGGSASGTINFTIEFSAVSNADETPRF